MRPVVPWLTKIVKTTYGIVAVYILIRGKLTTIGTKSFCVVDNLVVYEIIVGSNKECLTSEEIQIIKRHTKHMRLLWLQLRITLGLVLRIGNICNRL